MLRISVIAILSCGLVVACSPRETENAAKGGEKTPSVAATENLLDLAALEPDQDPAIAKILERVDAANDDGWDTEVISAAAQAELDTLVAKYNDWSRAIPEAEQPGEILFGVEYTDRQLEILQIDDSGHEIFLTIEAALFYDRTAFAPDTKIKIKVKTVGISPPDPGSGQFTTEVIYTASGKGEHGKVQQNAKWQCHWTNPDKPILDRIRITNHQTITPKPGGGLHFEDVTGSILESEQLAIGIDHWRPRLQGDFGLDVNGLQGIAIGDADGDGLDDVYICQQGGLPNKLFLRNDDGTLRDVSAAAGVDWMEVTRAALFVDLDNDGDQDLALAQGWYWMLMENDGSGKFAKRGETRAPSNLHSIAAADYDLDGDLDLFFCGRNPAREFGNSEGVLGQPMPYHDANNGGANVLLRNDGGWKFSDATVESGLDQNNRRYSYACSWQDYDLDGDPDLYVANDFGRNNLYRNDLGKFTDVAGELGVEDMSAGMGITWGDYNNDGRPDAYVSNMFSSAGNRITYQRQFREGKTATAAFQRHARGNTLFANSATGFEDVSEVANVTMARWAWGAKFVDLNNDGWEDLYVTNGFITTEDTGDL